eukprot:scaffold2037_cov247-Chaetoceros_neogracile.AAC.4
MRFPRIELSIFDSTSRSEIGRGISTEDFFAKKVTLNFHLFFRVVSESSIVSFENHGGGGYDRDRYGGPPRGGGYDGRGGGQQDRPPSGYDRGMKRERERHDDRGGGGGHYSRRRY